MRNAKEVNNDVGGEDDEEFRLLEEHYKAISALKCALQQMVD